MRADDNQINCLLRDLSLQFVPDIARPHDNMMPKVAEFSTFNQFSLGQHCIPLCRCCGCSYCFGTVHGKSQGRHNMHYAKSCAVVARN
jgi:hypothetical protein